jgi:N-acyl amino acid synthase of PEP-CTERM/exosortase system
MHIDNPFNVNLTRRLHNIFSDYFDIIPANTPQLLEAVYRLRYQVYCMETRFEDPKLHPWQLEIDEFDQYSVHSLLQHRRTGIYAGTARLILPRMDVEKCFPIHEVTNHPLYLDHKRFPRAAVAEISRFAISKEFRKRLGEFSSPSAASQMPETIGRTDERRIIPHIILGLVAALVRMSTKNGIKHWFCIVEQSLLRLLYRYSLQLIPFGPVINYHGQRQPCYVHLSQFLETAYREQPHIWELITDKESPCPSDSPSRSQLPSTNMAV